MSLLVLYGVMAKGSVKAISPKNDWWYSYILANKRGY